MLFSLDLVRNKVYSRQTFLRPYASVNKNITMYSSFLKRLDSNTVSRSRKPWITTIRKEGSYMNALFRRRSIRQYTSEAVPDDQVKCLLEAAMSAPSAGNQQPWQYMVITDKAMLVRLVDSSPYVSMLPNAAVAILVCGVPKEERHPGFWVQDCAAATQNILIEAEELGLGAVWLGMYPVEERMDFLRTALQIPEKIVPFALIAIGYPAEFKEPADRYDESRVHYETW
jgi:nitroreductase